MSGTKRQSVRSCWFTHMCHVCHQEVPRRTQKASGTRRGSMATIPSSDLEIGFKLGLGHMAL